MRTKLLFMMVLLAGVGWTVQSNAQSLQISGPLSACLNEPNTYQILGPLPDNPIVLWQVDEGTSTGIGSITEIIFSGGLGLIEAEIFGTGFYELISLDVDLIQPEANFDFPTCNSNETKDLLLICSGAPTTLDVLTDPSNSISWNAPAEINVVQQGADLILSGSVEGEYSMSVTITSPEGCQNTYEFDVTINPTPDVIINSTPPAVNDVITICTGESILFQGSLNPPGATNISWNFGDGYLGNGANVIHEYDQPGTYLVTASYSSRCCAGTETVTVIVEPGEGVELDCYSPACIGDVVSYCAATACGGYQWTVEGGTIQGGQGTECIEVLWGDPNSGFGVINLNGSACGNLCSNESSFFIPIAGAAGLTSNETAVCVGSNLNISTVNQFGIIYNYSISPSQGATITTNTNNFIIVQFDEPGVYVISADGSSALLNCDLHSELTITATSPPDIDVDNACSGEDISVSINPPPAPGFPASYQLIHNGVAAQGEITSGTFTIPGAGLQGEYSLVINPNNDQSPFCATSVGIEIGDVQSPSDIDGPMVVCPGQAYNYAAVGYDPFDVLQWTVSGGMFNGTSSTYTGQTPEVIWSGSGGTLSVYAETADGLCPTMPIEISVISLTSGPLEIEGEVEVCNSGTNPYVLTPDPEQTVVWELSNPLAGSIVQGQFTNEIVVAWNYTTSQLNTDIIAHYADCDGNPITSTLNVVVTPTPIPTVVNPPLACPNSTVTFQFENIGSAGNVTALFDTGETVQGSGTTFMFDLSNSALEGLNTTGIHYVVFTIEEPDGCVESVTVNGEFEVSAEPMLGLTSPDPTCPICAEGISLDMFLAVQLQQGGFSDYTFEWYFIPQGVGAPELVGMNVQQLSVFELGIYYVVVTNSISGCVTISNPLSFTCRATGLDPIGVANVDITLLPQGTGLPGGVFVSGEVVTGLPQGSNPFGNPCTYKNIAGGIDGGDGGEGGDEFLKALEQRLKNGGCEYFYIVSDPITGDHSFGPESEFTYNFEYPGYYPVQLWIACMVEGQILWSYIEDTIIIPYIPSFEYSIACGKKDGMYEVNFFNTSLYLEGLTGISDMWILDGDMAYPGSGSLSVNLYPGEHCMRFEISHPDFPTYYYEECFTLEEIPDSYISVVPQSGCENTVFNFSVNYTGDIYEPLWDFGDGTFSILQNPQKTFTLIGGATETFIVKLTFETIYGCEYSDEIPVTVYSSELSGVIEQSESACLLDPIRLTFVPDVPGNYTYLWNTGETTDFIEVDESGYYFVYVFDGDCAYMAGIQAIVGAGPQVAVSLPDEICPGNLLDVSAVFIEGATYSWNINGQALNGHDPFYFVQLSAPPGNINVDLVMQYGDCEFVFNGSVEVLAAPAAPTISIDIIGDCDHFQAVLSTGIPETMWNNGQEGPSITVSFGSYSAYVIGESGCKSLNANASLPAITFPNAWPVGCFDPCLEDIVANPVSIPIGNGNTLYFNGSVITVPGNILVIDGPEDAGSYFLERCRTYGVGADAITCCEQSGVFEIELESCTDCSVVHVMPEGMGCTEYNGQVAYDFRICINNLNYDDVEIVSTNGTLYNVTYTYTGLMVIMEGIFIPTDPMETMWCVNINVTLENGGTCSLSHCENLPVCLDLCPPNLVMNIHCAGSMYFMDGSISIDPNCTAQNVFVSMQFTNGSGTSVQGYLNPGNNYTLTFNSIWYQSFGDPDVCVQLYLSAGMNYYTEEFCYTLPNCGSCEPTINVNWNCGTYGPNYSDFTITSTVPQSCNPGYIEIEPLQGDFMYLFNGQNYPASFNYYFGYGSADGYYFWNGTDPLMWLVTVYDANGITIFQDVVVLNYPCNDGTVGGGGGTKSAELESSTFDFQVMPNPSSGSMVTLIIPIIDQEILSLEVFDISGRLVQEERFYATGMSDLNTSELASGQYLLKLKDSNEKYLGMQRLQIIR
jgi:hypothetical protein